MPSSILITGGSGFLGRAVARRFKALGHRVVGLGHARFTPGQALANGFDTWFEGDVSSARLATLPGPWDVVVHCAGNSSVAYSLDHPLEAFQKTVQSTAELLEHLRQTNPQARLIYPSSAAVYGAADDRPLSETDVPNPVSPYGFHKKITEDLLQSYASCFGIRSTAIRFFSIYGLGLAKQLLWDATARLCAGQPRAVFWGTGEETRDWIHVDDAAALIASTGESHGPFMLINGGSGVRVTVSKVLHQLRDALALDVEIGFNGTIKPGDPRFYQADMSRLHSLGWQPHKPLAEGIAEYAPWARQAQRAASPEDMSVASRKPVIP